MSDLNVLIYRRQPDATYKWEGELVAAASGYQIMQAETGRAFGDFSLERAKEILEKGPLRQEWYKVIPIPEKEVSGAAAKAKARKAEKEAKIASGELPAPAPKAPKAPKEPRQPKVYEKKMLDEAEVIRVNAIQLEANVDREAAIKLLRKEQRIARLAEARAIKGPSKYASKIDDAVLRELYPATNANQIAKKFGVGYMTVRLRLIKLGLLVVPAKPTTKESAV